VLPSLWIKWVSANVGELLPRLTIVSLSKKFDFKLFIFGVKLVKILLKWYFIPKNLILSLCFLRYKMVNV
jgi:hypothetical protein